MAFKQVRDLVEWIIRRCGDDFSGHDVGYLVGMCLDIIGGKRLVPCQCKQPPRTLPLGTRLGAMQQVALAHDADELAMVVDHRNGTDPSIQEKFGHLLHIELGLR